MTRNRFYKFIITYSDRITYHLSIEFFHKTICKSFIELFRKELRMLHTFGKSMKALNLSFMVAKNSSLSQLSSIQHCKGGSAYDVSATRSAVKKKKVIKYKLVNRLIWVSWILLEITLQWTKQGPRIMWTWQKQNFF